MEIRFCDRCSESIPEGDFEAGKAITVSGKHYHASCALARSLSLGGPRTWLTFLLALYAAGVGTYLLATVLGKPDVPKVSDEVKAAISTAVNDADQSTRAEMAEGIDAVRKEIATQTSAAAKSVQGEVRAQVDVLKGRVEEMDGAAVEHLQAQKKRIEGLEKEVAALNNLLREVKEQADRIEAQRAAEAARRKPDPVPETAPQPTPEPTPPMASDPPGGEPPGMKEEVERWIRRLNDPNENIRFSATLELGRLKSLLAVPPLLKVLKDDRDYYVRLGAATALGDIRAVDAVLPLVDALEDDDALVRTAANDALQAITEQPFEFVPGMTRSERRKLQKRWRNWFKENEIALRDKLKQPKPA